MAATSPPSSRVRPPALSKMRTRGDIVPSSPEDVAALWRELAADRSRLVRSDTSRKWVKEHADYTQLAEKYMELISELLGKEPATHR